MQNIIIPKNKTIKIEKISIILLTTNSKRDLYLVGIMDENSRKILSWKLSNSLNVEFLKECFSKAVVRYGIPEIFNNDQGSQYHQYLIYKLIR